MKQLQLLSPATSENFDERGYLLANPDVAAAIQAGVCASAREHFDAFHASEQRMLRVPIPAQWKAEKLSRLHPLLVEASHCQVHPTHLDCLTEALRAEFRIIATDNISAHEYDQQAMALIRRHSDGLVLDCGAGLRNTYYGNVVNYEIVAYDTTDVLGVAERLPFKDNSFDAVLSLNVLEHVKDPFQSARELMRVLKPGGELMCVAPFLQPLHGYPHHYYNMTGPGLLNLFDPLVEKRTEIYGALRPVWALNWFLNSYNAGLPPEQREQFQAMTVAQLMASPATLEPEAFVTVLSAEASTELASAHALFARKPTAAHES